jgi:cyanate permease
VTTATETPPTAAPDSPYRWVVLSGIWLIYFSFGLQINGLAPLVGPVAADLGLSYSAMGTILAAWPMLYVFASIPCGAAVDRLGAKRALLIAAAIMSVSAITRGLAIDFWSLFFAVALFGIGGPLLSITTPKAIAKWFTGPQRGLAMGIYFTGPSLGSIAALASSNTLLMPLTGNNWRWVLMIYAAFMVVGGLYWWALSTRAAFRAVDSGDDPAGRGTIREQIAVFGYLLKNPAVVLILLMSMGMFYFYDATTNWLPEILISHGLAAGPAGLWASAPIAVGGRCTDYSTPRDPGTPFGCPPPAVRLYGPWRPVLVVGATGVARRFVLGPRHRAGRPDDGRLDDADGNARRGQPSNGRRGRLVLYRV